MSLTDEKKPSLRSHLRFERDERGPLAAILGTVALLHIIGWGLFIYYNSNPKYHALTDSKGALVYAGATLGHHPLEWIGAGMTAYGLLYFVAHDGLVHQRWPFRYVPRSGYLKRLYQAHRMHHAVSGKDGAVSFGFLYAPPVEDLKRRLHALHQGPLRRRRPDAATGRPDAAAAHSRSPDAN